MSDFAATLRDLLGRATGGPCSVGRTSIRGEGLLQIGPQESPASRSVQIPATDARLLSFLRNHAEDVLAVVEAAQKYMNLDAFDPDPTDQAEAEMMMSDALAKLDAGGE